MSLKDKIKLFFDNFFNDNKAVFITLMILGVLFIFTKLNTVEAGYIVEYVNLTEEVDLGYFPTNNTKVFVDFQFGWDNGKASIITAGWDIRFHGFGQYPYFSTYWAGNNGGLSEVGYGRNTIEFDKNFFYYNGYLKKEFSDSLTFNSSQSFKLNTDGLSSTLKIYGVQIYEDNVLVRDFVPTLTDDLYGFKDKCNDVFISAGSGATGGDIIESDEVPFLEMSFSTTEITDLYVTMFSQPFSEDFRNTHYCYYSYKEDINGKSIWYPAWVNGGGSYYATALENGAYTFKLTDLEGNVLNVATMNVTNIQSVGQAVDESVLRPSLFFEPDQTNSRVIVKTQTLSADLINRYKCYYWFIDESTELKKEAVITKSSDNEYYFSMSTAEDASICFVFYDNVLNKYSQATTANIDVNEVLTNPAFGHKATISDLLEQKFGLFYWCVDFLKEFWEIITSDNPEPPDFTFTMPDFLGGGTYNIFNLEIFNKYKNYVHYIIAGFIYFFYIKKLTKTIPALINEVGN